MAVVGIGVMGVFMGESLVVVRVRMWLGGVFAQGMLVHVVPIMVVCVHMRVRMAVRGVLVQVCMVFCQMQPHAQPHQGTCSHELPRYRFCKSQYRHDCAHKRRRRKISPSA